MNFRPTLVSIPKRFFPLLSGIVCILPLTWALANSLRAPATSWQAAFFGADFRPSVDAYIQVWKEPQLFRYFLTSASLGILSATGVVGTSILAAHALVHLVHRARLLLLSGLLVCKAVSPEVFLVPNYLTIVRLGLYDTVLAVLLPQLSSIFAILVLYRAFSDIGREHFDAARLDGCGNLAYLWHVALPLCRGPIGMLAVLSFIWSWNMLAWPLMVTSREAIRPASHGLLFLANSGSVAPSVMFAASVVLMVPPLVLVLWLGLRGNSLRSEKVCDLIGQSQPLRREGGEL